MTNKHSPSVLPARLLLATDLGARCDRALDRAAQLAKEWQAELIVLNVLDVSVSPDQLLAWASGMDDESLYQIARQQLNRDLSKLDVHASIRTTRTGNIATTIRDVAAESDCGLVVTGVARNEVIGRFLLGSTVESLSRMLPQPLLVVRNRAYVPYKRIIIATDFSESSRHALQAAARLFPGRELILYHAYQTPLSGSSGSKAHAQVSREIERGEYAKFLAATELPANVTVRPVIEHGPLETAMVKYVRQHEVELVVIGSHGRSGVMSVLLGSSAAKLLDWLPCDTLVVREPRAID
ncbi:Universal stress protein A [Methylophilaceae bacterium]|nr:Universal stress protein A [Methylophilaceae bacterium]